MKVIMYKIIKIFKWKFAIRVPNFMNPWEYNKDGYITFKNVPTKNDILKMYWEKK